MSKRQERHNIFQQLLNAGYDGGTAGAIANAPNIHNAHKRFHAAMRNPPGRPAAPAPPPPAAPAPPPVAKAPLQVKATQASMGQGVRRPKKTQVKTRLSDLRIKRPKINTALAIGAGGTGLNVGGY